MFFSQNIIPISANATINGIFVWLSYLFGYVFSLYNKYIIKELFNRVLYISWKLYLFQKCTKTYIVGMNMGTSKELNI